MYFIKDKKIYTKEKYFENLKNFSSEVIEAYEKRYQKEISLGKTEQQALKVLDEANDIFDYKKSKGFFVSNFLDELESNLSELYKSKLVEALMNKYKTKINQLVSEGKELKDIRKEMGTVKEIVKNELKEHPREKSIHTKKVTDRLFFIFLILSFFIILDIILFLFNLPIKTILAVDGAIIVAIIEILSYI